MTNSTNMALLGLGMLFMTCLLGSNIIAIKLINVGSWVGGSWVISAGILLYPLTFLFTDTISEIFGRRQATFVVWFGFIGNVILVAAIYLTGVIPSPVFWEDQGAYNTILGGVPRIVLGSMIGYLVSQNIDVLGFHFLKQATDGRFLWIRNNGSTMISQSIDTVLFLVIAFAGLVPAQVLWQMIWMQYVLKLAIAGIDTPFVYILVSILKKPVYAAKT